MNAARQYVASCFTAFVTAALLCGLSGCSMFPQLNTSKPVIPAVFSVKVSDPSVRRLLEAAQKVEVVARGRLRPGNYQVRGRTVTINKITDFRLTMSLPVDNPAVISTEHASGQLWTSSSVLVVGVPLPQTIELKDGKATSDIDLLRLLGTYFLNVINNQADSVKNQELTQIVDLLSIESARVDLKPDSFLKFDDKVLHVGKGSSVELKDAAIDRSLDYVGSFKANLNFLPGCNWAGEKVDTLFNGGSVILQLNANRVAGKVELMLGNTPPKVLLTDSTFKFGKEKRSSAHSGKCEITPTQIDWKKTEGQEDSELHVVAPMQLTNTDVAIRTKRQETEAHFQDPIPAKLSLDVTKEFRETRFSTLEPETASKATVHVNRPTTQLSLYLSDAVIDEINFDKHGEMDFSITKGTAKLDQIVWSNGQKTFKLTTKGHSTLSLPAGMNLSLNKDREVQQMVLPITVKLGSASFAGPAGVLQLSDLDGALMIVLDPDVHITSQLNFTLDQCKLLGDEKAEIKAKGLDVSSVNGQARLHLKSCTVTLPQSALAKAITARLPKEKVFNVNKVVSDRKWRYRNATVKTVKMSDLEIDRMNLKNDNQFTFKVQADLLADGTIDKGSLMAIIKSDAETETKPWKATATVSGDGEMDYSLLPNRSLADSELSYKVDVDLGFGDDVNLDWSKVTGGIAEGLERKVITGHLKKLEMPFKFDGKLRLFKDNKWNMIKLTKFDVDPAGSNAEIHFTADAVL